MDVSTLDSQSSAWGIPRRSLDVNEDNVLDIPNFSTIERFYPKGARVILNIMDELKNKSSQNLLVTTITGFNGLYGLHDNIFENKYKGASNLIFWVTVSFDLHIIVNLPNSIDQLLQQGEVRTFNFFESMYPLNIKIEAENSLAAAFQFWNLSKVITR